jgi:hypothetical protein
MLSTPPAVPARDPAAGRASLPRVLTGSPNRRKAPQSTAAWDARLLRMRELPLQDAGSCGSLTRAKWDR